MSFLQPIFLAGLALAALPVIIHLINQRRYQTIRWGAMMFLLAANRMSRGLARLRQWLILSLRMLAIACLALVVARPLAGGWLGAMSAGRTDVAIVLLDRSPSMQQRQAAGGRSKLETGRSRLVDLFHRLPASHWVLIESTTNKPRDLESPDALDRIPETGTSGATADVPAMLQAAHDYLKANQSGNADIWICSDLRQNDWRPDDARWEALRSGFAAFPQGIRLRLLAFGGEAEENVAIRLTNLRRRKTEHGGELLLSLRLTRTASAVPRSIPIEFNLAGARSVLNVELAGDKYELRDYPLPLGEGQSRGWGRVSIPADANPADNDFYFAFDPSQTRRSLIIADDPQVGETLRLAASIPADPGEACAADVMAREQALNAEWAKISLVLWQAPLPEGQLAKKLEALADRGGRIIFFPSQEPGAESAFGVRWQAWRELPPEQAIDNWRGDEDLLANTQSGMALPVGQLELRQVCSLSGEAVPLATLTGGEPLAAKVSRPRGGVYFFGTTPALRDSNLAADGVVLYAVVQRALTAGAAAMGDIQQRAAGEPEPSEAASWRRLAGDGEAISTENAFQCGVYSDSDALIAVNRSEDEDLASTLSDDRIGALFDGLDFVRIDDEAGGSRSLAEETWRSFMAVMMLALLGEAWLCMPRMPVTAGGKP